MHLLFIYNADSGKLNALFDIGHKIVNPESYSCNLCSLTHGTFAERKEWKRFKESTSLDLVFLHRDEFEKQFGQGSIMKMGEERSIVPVEVISTGSLSLDIGLVFEDF